MDRYEISIMIAFIFIILFVVCGGIISFVIYNKKLKFNRNQQANIGILQMFTSDVYAQKSECNSENQIEKVSPYLSNGINKDFTNRKCSIDD